MSIYILVTGGTFDKEYDMINGKLYFDETHIPEILDLGRCKLDIRIRTLMMIDSLDMTDQDRIIISDNCARLPTDRIVITHGTDTMVQTARIIGGERTAQDHCPDRSIDPVHIWTSGWVLQSGKCAGL